MDVPNIQKRPEKDPKTSEKDLKNIRTKDYPKNIQKHPKNIQKTYKKYPKNIQKTYKKYPKTSERHPKKIQKELLDVFGIRYFFLRSI